MSLQGKTIAILVENQYEDIELWYPLFRLREAGAKTIVIGREKDATYTGKRGYPMTAEASPSTIGADDLDGLVVPGGYAPDRMRTDSNLMRLVREIHTAGKPVGMICHAGWVGISAGIVDGKRLTSVRSIRDDLVNAGAEWFDEEVVVDGNLITSRTPSDLPAFMRTFVDALA